VPKSGIEWPTILSVGAGALILVMGLIL
jgi:hypothetical protein